VKLARIRSSSRCRGHQREMLKNKIAYPGRRKIPPGRERLRERDFVATGKKIPRSRRIQWRRFQKLLGMRITTKREVVCGREERGEGSVISLNKRGKEREAV